MREGDRERGFRERDEGGRDRDRGDRIHSDWDRGRGWDRRESFRERDRDYGRRRPRVCIEDEDGDIHCRYH